MTRPSCPPAEEVFGWINAAADLRQTKHRGLGGCRRCFPIATSAFNLIRLPKLLATPTGINPLRIVGGQPVEDHVDFLGLILLHHAAYEIEKLRLSAFVLPPRSLPVENNVIVPLCL